VHLLDYPKEVLEGVLVRARLAGVRYLVNNATSAQQSEAIHELAQRFKSEAYPKVVKSFGVHPLYLESIKGREGWL
jgi:Tat protein secretion system quality control protein TatD with DNase activity